MNQRGLAGAVWTKQANGAPAQFALQVLQDWPPAKRNAQIVEIDDRSEVRRSLLQALLVPELFPLVPSCRLYIPVLIIPNKTETKSRAHQDECTDECKRFCAPLKFYQSPKFRSEKPEY